MASIIGATILAVSEIKKSLFLFGLMIISSWQITFVLVIIEIGYKIHA